MTNFINVTIKLIRRELNTRADRLAKGATSGEYRKKTELVIMEDTTEGKGPERLYKMNMINIGEVLSEVDGRMKEIMDFLQ